MTYQWHFELERMMQEKSQHSETRSTHVHLHMQVKTVNAQATATPQVLRKLLKQENTRQLTGEGDE